MKLAALGLVTAVIGVALGVEGLLGIGIFWILLGPLIRAHGRRILERREELATADTAAGKPRMNAPIPMDARTFAVGTVLWFALGVPSVVVGVLRLGIDDAHENWRWLPIAIGGFALAIGVLAGLMYLIGGAVLKVTGPEPTLPATIRIRAVRDTGTFINERPRLEFDLTVEPDGGAPYEVQKKATVPFSAMGSIRVGDGFRARVAGPEEPTSMTILWEEPVPGDPR